MRRSLRISAWIVGSLAALIVLLIVAVLVAGNTGAGRGMIERLTYRLTDGNVKLTGLGGSFPSALTLDRLELIDRGGVWLTAEHIALRWSPSALLERRIRAESLTVARLDMERTPLPSGTPSTGKPSVPHIDIDRFSIDVVQLGAALAGRPATLSIAGSGRMISLEDARIELQAHRIDRDGSGDYTLNLRFDPKRMDGTLIAHEPASGPLENILQVPGLGALSANVSIAGPHNAEQIDVELSAGEMKAQVRGSVDLSTGSAALDYSVTAPQVSPRPDLKWQRLALDGHWKGTYTDPAADAHLEVEGLVLPAGSAIANLHAELHAAGGDIALKGVVQGLRIPGSAPALLERDPLKIDASMRVKDPTRPLTVAATHRLFLLNANAVTAGQQNVAFVLKLPSIAPFAALAGEALNGEATVKGRLERRESDMGFDLDADATLAGGGPSWTAMVGNRIALGISGALSDATFKVERLKVTGKAWSLSASGNAERPAPAPSAGTRAAAAGLAAVVKSLDARFTLDVADLGIVASSLGGTLQASGRLSGPAAALSTDATLKSTLSVRGSAPGAVTAELHARGLPNAPSASIAATGTLDGSPLNLAVTLARAGRNGLHAKIERGAWKSAKLDGEWSMESTFADSRGQVHVDVGELGDLDHLLGRDIRGKLEGSAQFIPQGGSTHARFELDAENLAFSGFAGTVHVSGEGSTDAVAAKLDVKSPDVNGFPATLAADAAVDLAGDNVRVLHAVAAYRGQQFRLLAPAKMTYAPVLRIDELRLGAQSAVLDIHGELTPDLDLQASLSHVDPKLINAFVPDAVAEGTIEASAHLRGTLAAPTGHVQLVARGIRSAADEAVGLPALDLNAGAELKGNSAAIDIKLKAGSNPLLSVIGDVPLQPAGVYDLKAEGKMDVGAANALLEARGMHASGALAIDANVAGTLVDPRIHGSVTLTNGSFRDYVRGVSLTNIAAEIAGNQGTLQIKSFKASAASGTVSMGGSVGILQPGIPVDLTLTADNAQPIASNILTANLNADIHVSGKARERLAVAGNIRVNRAVIGIPDSLPPNVAVLDVRRRGKVVQAAGKELVIDLDISITARREVLVQGRGLDAELGGDGLHIGGTTDTPVISGRLGLLRGTFSIGSTQLTFDKSSNVSFDGTGLKKGIDPTLDFTARSVVQNTTSSAQAGTEVTLHITGYADAPKIELTSTGGQSQDEMMALLLFGEPASQLSALQLAQVSYALATLAGIGGGGSNPLTRLQKSLGLDRLSVAQGTTTTATGATENTGAAVQAGRYVTKRIYVEGKQSTTGQSQVEVDVDLTKHLKLQTRLGNGTAVQGTTPQNDPGSSVGLSYQFEY